MSTGKTSTRRGYSRKVGTLLPPAANKVFRKYGFQEGTLIRQWKDIAGPNLSRSTLPLKMTFGKEKGERIAILHLLVEPAAAIEVQHQIPVLIEKIKIFYGNQAVSRIHLIQGTGTASPRPKTELNKPLSTAQEKTLGEWKEAMKGSGLKDSLIRIGEQILISEQN